MKETQFLEGDWGYSIRIRPEDRRVHADSEGHNFDGRSSNNLNLFLSLLRNAKDAKQLMEDFRKGPGVADQWGMAGVYADQEADWIEEFRSKFQARFGFAPQSPIWVVGSDRDDCVLIPHDMIIRLMEVWWEIEHGSSDLE
jgi:hypothetical protein